LTNKQASLRVVLRLRVVEGNPTREVVKALAVGLPTSLQPLTMTLSPKKDKRIILHDKSLYLEQYLASVTKK
jgi:hypothetical protein